MIIIIFLGVIAFAFLFFGIGYITGIVENNRLTRKAFDRAYEEFERKTKKLDEKK